jgi:hypothetical protein
MAPALARGTWARTVVIDDILLMTLGKTER